mmetsp:Transcript_57079/g.113481  ORF Transcript_57079/g.113481 Transcript_57079/m.113481 type:complete len:389 (-) Transcript_57079:144-1310(-)
MTISPAPHVTSSDDKPRVQVLDEIANSDLTATRKEFLFRTPFLVTMLTPLLNDERDVPMLCLMLNILQVMVPGVVAVFAVNMQYPQAPLWCRNLVGLGYMLTIVILFQERFTLMLHFASHRRLFKNNLLDGLLSWVYAPFFGIPPGSYRVHHIHMHHMENNHEWDASSTEPFQRDSLIDFMRYWFRFAFVLGPDLLYYIYSKRPKGSLSSIHGLLLWYPTIALLSNVNFLATLWVLIVPHFFSLTAMAFGNWSQHCFVDPQNRHSNYALTYNCIDTPGNQTTFNDGYHIVHHVNPRLHWSEIPEYFHKNKNKHLEGGAIVFRGLHFFDVGFLVMSKNLEKLARHYVHLGPRETAPTLKEVEHKLRASLKPALLKGAAAGTETEAKKEK